MMNVNILSVVMTNVIMLSVVTSSVIMLSVVMTNFITLSVVAPQAPAPPSCYSSCFSQQNKALNTITVTLGEYKLHSSIEPLPPQTYHVVSISLNILFLSLAAGRTKLECLSPASFVLDNIGLGVWPGAMLQNFLRPCVTNFCNKL